MPLDCDGCLRRTANPRVESNSFEYGAILRSVAGGTGATSTSAGSKTSPPRESVSSAVRTDAIVLPCADGLPVATGAAIGARGQRRVISLQADGSAMYSLQALWTQARERLPNTTILLNNRSYAILIGEHGSVGATPGPTAMSMLDLGDPLISWTKLANGLGVEAARAETMEECADLMTFSFEQPGPFLIELMTSK
jgi:thiamine pyrophosphate-dependent acetolactate synthase large subunit-like protein